jgi:hypothetical protein
MTQEQPPQHPGLVRLQRVDVISHFPFAAALTGGTRKRKEGKGRERVDPFSIRASSEADRAPRSYITTSI